MKKYICIKQYSSQIIIGNCYNIEIDENRFCKIANYWFSKYNKDNDFSPLLSDYFISESELRKNKLNNLKNIII